MIPKVVASDRLFYFKGDKTVLKDALMMIEMMGGLSHVIVGGKTYRIELLNP